MQQQVKIFKSNTKDYHDAFQVFLDHTDQKHKAKQWIESFVNTLPSKKTFVDAGAGNGKVTAWFTSIFDQTIAIEPNPTLSDELAVSCPKAEIFRDTILNVNIKPNADFILASHVFYYIPKEEWTQTVERLTSWLSPNGSLVVMLQNSGTDCMSMLKHFFGKSFDLGTLERDFKNASPSGYEVKMETVDSRIRTPDFRSAYTVAEFMMNLLPIKNAPARRDLENYVEQYFKGNGEYYFSCNQDFLQIRRK